MEATLVQFPYYANVTKEMKARITHLPPISLRDLRQIHLNALIKVCGVVTRQTAVFPQLDLVKYNCAKVPFSFILPSPSQFLTPRLSPSPSRSVIPCSVLSNKQRSEK